VTFSPDPESRLRGFLTRRGTDRQKLVYLRERDGGDKVEVDVGDRDFIEFRRAGTMPR
jgi:hypothetical protein